MVMRCCSALALLVLAVAASCPAKTPPPEERKYVRFEFEHIGGAAFGRWLTQTPLLSGPQHPWLAVRWPLAGDAEACAHGRAHSVMEVAGEEETIDLVRQLVTAVEAEARRLAESPANRIRVECRVVRTKTPGLLLAPPSPTFEVELDNGRRVDIPKMVLRPEGFEDAVLPTTSASPGLRVVAVNQWPRPEVLAKFLQGPLALSGSQVVTPGTPAVGTVLLWEGYEGSSKSYEVPFSITPLDETGGMVTVIASIPQLYIPPGPGGQHAVQVIHHPVQFTAPANQTVAVGLVPLAPPEYPCEVFLITLRPARYAR